MTIRKFLLEVMVCISSVINLGVKSILSLVINQKPMSKHGAEINLTAMGYSKQADLFELTDLADPQCKCDLHG